jgi:2-phosphosulfolactate phosphatase
MMARSVFVHMLPGDVPRDGLAGSDAVVVDVLRASTTIVAALDAGADSIIPCTDPNEAFRLRDTLAGSLLGGERGGVRVPGFDLGNSPAEYSHRRLRGRTVIFTTTNGTRALHHAAGADQTFVGCFRNVSAVAATVVRHGRDVHLVCAGTDGSLSIEDCLGAGALAGLLLEDGYLIGNDGAMLAVAAAAGFASDARGLDRALRDGRGGRNLRALGLESDIDFAAQVDRSTTVPELGRDGSIRAAPPPAQ